MRVLFVEPPDPPGFVSFRHSHGGYGEFCVSSRLRIPTLDLFHCAAFLREGGVDASVLDSALLGHSPRACVAEIARRRPALVAFRTASGSCLSDLKTAALLRRSWDAPVVFFGPHAAAETERLLASPGVDAVASGEPYEAFLRMARQDGFAGIAGVRFRDPDGGLAGDGSSPRLKDLDSLPVTRWDEVPFQRYSYVTAQTSWGCPRTCSYCPYRITQGSRWRTRSAASVVREFQALRDRYGLRYVELRDPEFACGRERTLRLCRALRDAGTPILWGCETGLDTLDPELLAAMAGAGCIRLKFGVDTLNPETLRRTGRRALAPAEVRRRVEQIRRSGMLTYAFYMIGLPGETTRSTLDLIEFSLDLGTHIASFSAATPFAGTALARDARAFGRYETLDPLHLTSCVPSMRNETMDAAEIGRLYRLAKSRWKERSPASSPR